MATQAERTVIAEICANVGADLITPDVWVWLHPKDTDSAYDEKAHKHGWHDEDEYKKGQWSFY